MALDADLFQMLVTLPNVEKGRLWEHVAKILVEFETHAVRPRGKRKNIVPHGRVRYLGRLAQHGREHLSKAEGTATRYQTWAAIPFDTPTHGNRVRDFYHHAYYAAFFAARHALVANGEYDCSIHAEMPAVLKKRLAVKAGLQNDAQRTASLLEELVQQRSDADYVMNNQRLAALASPQLLTTQITEVQAIFIVWGIP